MSLLQANNVDVIGGSILMPLSGTWTADLVIDQLDGSGFDPGTKVTLKATDGFQLQGSVAADRTGSFLDAVHVRLVGGAAGMLKTVKPRGYAQPSAFARDVLNGLAADSGETLSSTIATSISGSNLVAWTVTQSTMTQALQTFLSFVAPTANWRFLADGTLWMGTETWPSSNDVFDILEMNPKDGTADLGINSPSILPGVALAGVGNVNRVEHVLSADGVRSHVWIDLPSGDRGVKAAISTIIAEQVSPTFYYGLYECQVISQSGDLSTVDVQMMAPFNAVLPGQQRVQVRAGTGVQVQFTPNAKLLLGWKGGDPRAPYVVPGLGADGFTAWSLGSSADNVATKTDLGVLMSSIANAAVLANDGGATFKSNIGTALETAGWAVATADAKMGSSVVKVQR